MLPFILIVASLLLGVIGFLLILHIGDNVQSSDVISPRKLPDDFDAVAATGLGLTLVGTVLALASSLAPLTLGSHAGAVPFWWLVGFAPAALQWIFGTYDWVRIVYPLKQSWKTWCVVVVSWASGGLFAWATAVSLTYS